MLVSVVVAISYNFLEDAMCWLIVECVSLELEMEVLCHGGKFKMFLTFPMMRFPFSISITKALSPLKKAMPFLCGYQRCSLINLAQFLVMVLTLMSNN